jgi:hypothetical protein
VFTYTVPVEPISTYALEILLVLGIIVKLYKERLLRRITFLLLYLPTLEKLVYYTLIKINILYRYNV